MPYHKTHLVTERGQHRLHDSLRDLCVLVDALFTAVHVNLGRPLDFKEEEAVGFVSRTIDMSIFMPLGAPVRFAIANRPCNRISVEVAPTPAPFPDNLSIHGFMDILPLTVSPIFVQFFETHRDWAEQTYPNNRANWPPVLNFASAVRNAISHDGKIRFLRPNATPAEWRGLRYSFADNGRPILGTDLGPGDLILLMFEMSDELDALGCPLTP
jgi:hypothetical protein